MVLSAALLAVAGAVPPLTPDGDEARRWAEQELSDPAYAAAEPTFIDRVASAVGEFFANLFSAEVPSDWGAALAIVAGVVVAVVVVAAFLIWGVPRSTRRARARVADLFLDEDERSADDLRRDAAACAARGAWDDAVVLHFRALARGTLERGAVTSPPGATVHAYAQAAGRAFPASADDLERAAAAFDDVRYLRRPGTPDLYRRIAQVDDDIVAARPVITPRAEVPV